MEDSDIHENVMFTNMTHEEGLAILKKAQEIFEDFRTCESWLMTHDEHLGSKPVDGTYENVLHRLGQIEYGTYP